MRKRIKKVPIASSENYLKSREDRANFIRDWHNDHIVEIETLTVSLKRQKFVKVFGKLIPVSEVELSSHLTLITIE